MAAIDVTDETFQTEVIDRSTDVAVVVDLWAEWCGPCKTLGPIIEKVVDATDGKVVLAKVDVDANPGISQAFRVQSIPAVYALKDGQVVDGFVGAYPEQEVQRFVESLLPTEEESQARRADRRRRRGQPAAWRWSSNRATRTPSSPSVRSSWRAATARRPWRCWSASPRASAPARWPPRPASARRPTDDYDQQLAGLLDRVKDDDDARQQFVDLLELMGPDDPRTAGYRRQLTARLF